MGLCVAYGFYGDKVVDNIFAMRLELFVDLSVRVGERFRRGIWGVC